MTWREAYLFNQHDGIWSRTFQKYIPLRCRLMWNHKYKEDNRIISLLSLPIHNMPARCSSSFPTVTPANINRMHFPIVSIPHPTITLPYKTPSLIGRYGSPSIFKRLIVRSKEPFWSTRLFAISRDLRRPDRMVQMLERNVYRSMSFY